MIYFFKHLNQRPFLGFLQEKADAKTKNNNLVEDEL